MREIQATRTVGDKWLVTKGVSAGDRVITEGLIRIKPGQLVKPVPAGSPLPTPASSGAAAGH